MATHSPTRDPDDYEWSFHLTEDSLSSETRFLTDDMIAETIAEGRDAVRSVNDETVRRKKTYDGVDVVVVLAPKAEEAVTAWTEIASLTEALAPDSRWSQDQIEVIQATDDENQHIQTDR